VSLVPHKALEKDLKLQTLENAISKLHDSLKSLKPESISITILQEKTKNKHQKLHEDEVQYDNKSTMASSLIIKPPLTVKEA